MHIRVRDANTGHTYDPERRSVRARVYTRTRGRDPRTRGRGFYMKLPLRAVRAPLGLGIEIALSDDEQLYREILPLEIINHLARPSRPSDRDRWGIGFSGDTNRVVRVPVFLASYSSSSRTLFCHFSRSRTPSFLFFFSLFSLFFFSFLFFPRSSPLSSTRRRETRSVRR